MYIISGTLKNKRILTPKGFATRPTTNKLRESLFNICQSYIADSFFLDLFAGSGAMGLEAISRGSKTSYFVDADKESIKCIKENIQTLGVNTKCFPLYGDVFLMLKKLIDQKVQFEIIYADPPYNNQELSNQLIKLIDETDLLKKEGFFFIEESKETPLEKNNYKSIKLKSERKMGKAQLLQFEKI